MNGSMWLYTTWAVPVLHLLGSAGLSNRRFDFGQLKMLTGVCVVLTLRIARLTLVRLCYGLLSTERARVGMLIGYRLFTVEMGTVLVTTMIL